MKDRAMQALYLMALEPVAETTADNNSYGFRKERSTFDAREDVYKRQVTATLRSLRLLSFILRPSWATCTDTIWICSRPMSVCLNTI